MPASPPEVATKCGWCLRHSAGAQGLVSSRTACSLTRWSQWVWVAFEQTAGGRAAVPMHCVLLKGTARPLRREGGKGAIGPGGPGQFLGRVPISRRRVTAVGSQRAGSTGAREPRSRRVPKASLFSPLSCSYGGFCGSLGQPYRRTLLLALLSFVPEASNQSGVWGEFRDPAFQEWKKVKDRVSVAPSHTLSKRQKEKGQVKHAAWHQAYFQMNTSHKNDCYLKNCAKLNWFN